MDDPVVELTPSVAPEAEVPYVPYMDRIVVYPDGTQETGNDAERRICRVRARALWDQRAKDLKAEAKFRGDKNYTLDDGRMAAFLEFPPGYVPPLTEWPDVPEKDQMFVELCRKALNFEKIPDECAISAQLAWIAANLEADEPRVTKAPSKAALSWAIRCRLDPAVARTFWATYQTKRMSPGEKKPKASAFKEDSEHQEEEAAGARDEEIGRRLFGSEDPTDDG